MSAAEEIEPTLTARATAESVEIMEGLRFDTIAEAEAMLGEGVATEGVTDLLERIRAKLKEKAAGRLMRAAYSTTTAAIAQGRTETAEIYADEVALVEYSALLDNATCDACRSADGKVVKMGSGEYGRLQPPNARCRGRSRCRCVYIYVLKDEPRTGGGAPGAPGGPPKLAPIIPLFPEKPLLALPAPAIIPISKSPIPLKPKLPPSVKTTPTGLAPIPLAPAKPTVVAQPAPPKERAPRAQLTPRGTAAEELAAKDFIARGSDQRHLMGETVRAKLKVKIAEDVADRVVSTGALRERLRAAELAKGNTAVAATSPGNADALRGAALRHVDIINRHWAGTSSDSNQYAIAGQIAAAQEFGLGDAAMKRLKATVTGGGYGSKAGQDAWDEAQKLMSVPGVAETYRVALRAMYENTQAEFKAKGITHVTLERGMTVDVMALPKATRDALGTLTKGDAYNSPKYVPKVGALATAPIAMQPASSFAPDHATAELFTHGGSHEGSVGIILKGSVPVSRILGTARTGMGCLNEYEYVMLETKGQFEVQIGRQNMSVTMPDQP